MRKQRHAAVMVQLEDKSPQTGYVARHLPRPTRMLVRPHLPYLGVLDPIRMRSQHCAHRADVENVRIRAAIEYLRSEGMGAGNDGDVRLLAQGKAKREG